MRGSLGVLFAGSVVVGIAALLSTDSFSVWRALWSAPSAPFTPLAGNDVLARPGLFVLGTTHKVPTFTFLVRYENEYILIDAGSPGRREHSDDLLAAVGKAVKGGNLRLLLITHGHIDHVGALPDLLTAFPNLQVVFHANEEPYIAGGLSYSSVPSKEVIYQITFEFIAHNVSSSLPKSRYLLLQGEKGDLSAARGPNGELPRWTIPQGLITFYLASGHAPGQVAYVDERSGSMFPGDAIEMTGDFKDEAGHPLPHPPPPFLNPSTTEALASVGRLAAANFSRVYPVHDVTGKGASQEAMVQLAQEVAGEGFEQQWRAMFY